MIGRLNHVAIAVRDIAKAAEVYRKTLGATVSAVVPQPAHGVNTVFITLPNTKIELLEPLGRNRRSRNSWSAIPTAASIMSATRSTTSSRPATGSRRRAPACWATARPRSAPTTSRCCSCTPRTSAAPWSSSSRPDGSRHRHRHLFPDLVDHAVRGAALGRARPGRGGRTGHRSGRATVPRLKAKLIWTTIAAGVVWAICAVVYAKGLVTLDGLASLFGFPAQNR